MGDVINNMGNKSWSININEQRLEQFDKNNDGKISLSDLSRFDEKEVQVARGYIESSQMLNPEEKEFLNEMLDVMQKVKRISNEPRRVLLSEKYKNQKMQLGTQDTYLYELFRYSDEMLLKMLSTQ